MPDNKFEVGIAGDGGSAAARPVVNATGAGRVVQEVQQGVAQEAQSRSRRKLTRRDLLKAGLGIGILLALPKACSITGSVVGPEKILNKQTGEKRNNAAESSWGKILSQNGASRLLETVDFYRVRISGQQSLENFSSWEGEKSELGRYLMTLAWFVDDLRTEMGDSLDRSAGGVGRKNLITKLNDSKGELDDTDVYIKGVEVVGDYATKFNLQKMTNDDLRKYFTHFPNPVNDKEKYGLGWSSADWDLLVGVYTAVKNKDGVAIKTEMDTYRNKK